VRRRSNSQSRRAKTARRQAGGADAAAAAERAVEGTDPPSDTAASAEFRRHLARVLVGRAVEEPEAR